MKKSFNTRLEAIEWIANNTELEGHFEVLREQLNFNFIYTKELFIVMEGAQKEVIMLSKSDRK